MKKLLCNKHVRLSVVFALVMSVCAVSALALEDTDVTTVMTTAFQTMVDNMLVTASAVLPMALTILGLSITVGFAVKWFKRLTGKA